MPPAPENEPFDLEGLADLARKVSPEIAQQVDSDAGNVAPDPAPAPAVDEGEDLTPPESNPEPVEQPELDEEPTTSIADELEELNRQSAEAAKAKEVSPVEVPKTVETPKPVENVRDADLKLDERASTVLHPKTKKIIEERNQKIIAERNKAEALAKEKADMEQELQKLREAAKTTTVPKPVEEELTKLRERIRELDIAQDPTIETKYDAPIRQNQDKIIDVLKSFGLGQTSDGKPDPAAIEALKKSGMGFSAIAPHIKKLSDAGEEGAAEELREILRENIRIGREKEKEIGDWKTNFESKKQQTIQQSQQQQESYTTQVREHASKILNADIAELSKDFPYLNRPSEPLPTDTPAVARAKQDAITAFEAASQAVSKAVGALDPSKAPPEKALEAQGRVSASAVQGIILREHVLPRVKKELAELRARNAELEAKVGKIQTAGKLSRAHAAAASAPAGAKAALPESTEDAAKQIAREMGITIDS